MEFLYLGVGALIVFIIWSMTRGIPYVPTDERSVDSIVETFLERGSTNVLDIGSGDGRIVIALAEAGITAHGFEINPLLVLLSQWRIRRRGLKNASIHWYNFWNAHFSEYDGVVVFGSPHMMPKLERKLKHELEPGTLILSHIYQFPNLEPFEVRENEMYIYSV